MKKFKYTVRAEWHIMVADFEAPEGPAESRDVQRLLRLITSLRETFGEDGRKAGPGCFGNNLSRWRVDMAASRFEKTTYVVDTSNGTLSSPDADAQRYVTGWRHRCTLTFRHEQDARAFLESHADLIAAPDEHDRR